MCQTPFVRFAQADALGFLFLARIVEEAEFDKLRRFREQGES